jgi:hypothetical protein
MKQQMRQVRRGVLKSMSMDSLDIVKEEEEDQDPNKSNLTASTKSSTESLISPKEERILSFSTTASEWTHNVFGCQEDTTTVLEDVCSCPTQTVTPQPPTLGIASLSMLLNQTAPLPEASATWDAFSTTSSMETPAGRRRGKHDRRLKRLASLNESTAGPTNQRIIRNLVLEHQDPYDLSKSISELTMKSTYAQANSRLSESRRMAYYAVSKHHRQSGRGGNRRCYFTGKLILGGSPFYAGSVQQGLRTLVVFCMPSSLGLPKEASQDIKNSTKNIKSSVRKNRSFMDEMSLSVDEELDPNWELGLEYLLSVLPDPSHSMLEEMKYRFPNQYDTLPVQVRSPNCWQLYVKICFFSGLPIADGELHYKVGDYLSRDYGEEVVLSHEVMEAVNGESTQLLRLPNMKTFSYLKKHYQQQSGKLPDSFFLRNSWELVLPEI